MKEFKTIVLCADDFGLNSGVSQGILQLVRLNRLSAVSCMVNQPDFKVFAPELLALKDSVQIGLHFTLTEGNLLSKPGKAAFSLNELLIKSHLRLLNPELVANEVQAQLEQFIQVMGCLPDFIDGHQHVHQFPVIRQIILDCFTKQFALSNAYIRSTHPSLVLKPYQFKTMVMAITGSRALHSELKRRGIPHNSCFSGGYSFAKDSDYRFLFRQWLALVPNNTLIMCHPGEAVSSSDALSHTRPIELHYFSSAAFISDCQEFQVKLAACPKA